MERNHDKSPQHQLVSDDDTVDTALIKSLDDNDDDDDNYSRQGSPTVSSSFYNDKSFFELERDADRILDDIRNIGTDNSNNNDTQKKSRTAVSASSSRNWNIYRNMRSDTAEMNQPQELIMRISTDTSVVTCSSDHNDNHNDETNEDGECPNSDDNSYNDDDDSIVGELQRLESVTTAIRLSLIDTTNEASLLLAALAASKKEGGTSKSLVSSRSTIPPLQTHPVTTTTINTTTTTTTIAQLSDLVILNADNNNIANRSLLISILCIVMIWTFVIVYVIWTGETCSGSAFTSASLLTIDDQGVLSTVKWS